MLDSRQILEPVPENAGISRRRPVRVDFQHTNQTRGTGNVAANEPIMAGVAGRYATALFELANDESRLPEVERDLAAFEALLDESADLRRLVSSPVFSAGDQERALTAVLSRANVADLAQRFILLIARNRRLFAAPDMIRAFRALAARRRGEVTAEVVSAFALRDDQVAALKEALRVSAGKNVQLATRVDPSLLGGLVVKIGSRMIDSSLRTKLANLKVSLKGGV